MKTLLYSFAALLLLGGCGRDETFAPRHTILCGRIAPLGADASRVVAFNVADPFEPHSRRAAALNTDGSFRFDYTASHVNYATLRYGNRYLYLYTVPGDSLFIEIDPTAFEHLGAGAVRFGGSGAELCRQTACWFEYRFDSLRMELPADLPPEEYPVAIRYHMEAFDRSIDNYAARHPMDRRVRELARRDERCVAAYMTDYSGVDLLRVLREEALDLFSIENLRCMMDYGPALEGYLLAAVSDLYTGTETLTSDLVRRTAQRLGSDEHLTGPVRDYALYTYLAPLIKAYPAWIDSLGMESLFAEPRFAGRLKGIAREAMHPVLEEEPRLRNVRYIDPRGGEILLPEAPLLATLAARYPGRVLYIDLWATWCGPCRTEIRDHTPALHRLFQGDSTVVFVNCCLLSTPERWRQTIRDLRMEGEHYFLPDDASNLLMGAIDASGVPTYLLVDRHGRVRSLHASRPSDLMDAEQAIRRLVAESE